MEKLTQFRIENLRPTGWLKRQLEIEADGLAGNLDLVWPDVRDSAWIGGDREGWERVPYWLDGFIPLGLLLRRDDLRARAEKYITSILDRQSPDGWICPIDTEESEKYDIWAAFLIGKVLAQWAEETGDERAADALYRAMKNLWEKLQAGKASLFKWGKARWFECLIPILWLYRRTGEKWLVEMASYLKKNGDDWASFKDLWVEPYHEWTFHTHIVNVGMMFKYEELAAEVLGEKSEGKAEELWQYLTKYHGTSVGTIAGDECLAGLAANRGTELCSVVELMYSFEWLYRLTGDGKWLDRLERAAFNALPATFTDDMWAHQYDQQVNQISCRIFATKAIFGTNKKEAGLFGLEPEYGCCTANHPQGWPKLAANVFLRAADGVTCAMMLPETLETTINGAKVKIAIDTEYPFRHSAKYTVTASKPVAFTLRVRIPGWNRGKPTIDGIKNLNFRVNPQGLFLEDGKFAGGCLTIQKVWSGKTTFTLHLHDEPHLIARPYGLRAAEYGPLVFSLPLETEYVRHEYIRKDVERKFPFCDYELIPHSAWNYGFTDGKLTVREHKGDRVPFSSKAPRLTLETSLSPIEWGHEYGYRNVCARKPDGTTPIGEPVTVELYPYGCAKLRMTEMPRAGKPKTK